MTEPWIAALLGAIGVLVGSITTAIINYRKTLTTDYRQTRKDTIAEWQRIVKRQDDSLDELNRLLHQSHTEEHKCKEEVAQLKAEIRVLQSRITHLENLVNDLRNKSSQEEFNNDDSQEE